MESEKKDQREKFRLRKFDSERSLRAVEHIKTPSILNGSPIEPIEGFILADRDEYAVFFSFCFKNLSGKALKRLDVRLDFYYYQNIPYCGIDFSYCKKELTFGNIVSKGTAIGFKKSCLRDVIENGEIFGENSLIPITDLRYTNIKLVLVSAEYDSGEKEELGFTVNKRALRITELDRVSRLVFDRGDVFLRSKAVFPAKNVPQFGDVAWLCCCGNKNHASLDHCEKCQRSKATQLELLSDTALQKRKNEYISNPTAIAFHDKTKYSQNKYLENKHELRKKNEMAERAMEKVIEEQNKYGAFGLVKRFAVWAYTLGIITLVLGLAVILYLALKDPGEDEVNFFRFIRKLLEGDY